MSIILINIIRLTCQPVEANVRYYQNEAMVPVYDTYPLTNIYSNKLVILHV